jgi:cation diffusion facilitator CzcD-associated flavoprotein CzcO
VGNSASGIDIGAQIATVCAHPLLSSLRSQSFFLPPGAGHEVWKEELPEIAAFLPPSEGNRAIQFTNNQIETGVDAVVFCTGYLHSHPYLSFLNPSPQAPDGARTQHVYQHLFFIPNPTLAFINLAHKVIPFHVAESQAAAVARVWSNRISLPSQAEMEHWEAEEIATKGAGRQFHAMNYPLDADYINGMHAWCLLAEPRMRDEKLPPFWGPRQKWIRERFQAIKKAYADRGAARHQVKSLEELGFDYEKWREEEEQAAGGMLQETGEKAVSP